MTAFSVYGDYSCSVIINLVGTQIQRQSPEYEPSRGTPERTQGGGSMAWIGEGSADTECELSLPLDCLQCDIILSLKDLNSSTHTLV